MEVRYVPCEVYLLVCENAFSQLFVVKRLILEHFYSIFTIRFLFTCLSNHIQLTSSILKPRVKSN